MSYSVLIVATVWSIIYLIIIFPKSDQDVKKVGNTAYIPYGSTLVISAGKSTMFITPSEELIERKLLFIVPITTKPVMYSENTVIHWGPLFQLTVKKVPGGIELTKPWLAKFR